MTDPRNSAPSVGTAPLGAHAAPASEPQAPQVPAHAAPGAFEPEPEPGFGSDPEFDPMPEFERTAEPYFAPGPEPHMAFDEEMAVEQSGPGPDAFEPLQTFDPAYPMPSEAGEGTGLEAPSAAVAHAVFPAAEEFPPLDEGESSLQEPLAFDPLGLEPVEPEPLKADPLQDPAAPAAAPAASAAPAPLDPIEAVPDPTAPTSPEDTAEIDVAAVEAKLSDPGSTQSFAPITEDLIDTDATFDAGTSSALMWGARSDVGCVRNHNEDSYLVASPLFCVCDGMGGHAAGEVASAIAVETIAKTGPKTANAAQLGAAIEAANAAIIEAAVNGVGRPGMGCTATAAVIEGTTLAIAHVGDSRAYLLHEGTLIRVTRDHSYVEELVDAGEITADEARVHPNRSVITRALGSDPAMYADHFTLNIEEGDRLILCSDGLSSMIPDGEIERVALQSSTAQICTDNLVDAALAAGGGDNVTVVVVDVRDDGRLRELAKKHRKAAIIGAVALLAAIALAALVAFNSITGSIYLGVKDGAVAIYSGVPDQPFGLKLHWLEDETSVLISDLPEDTQKRLLEGIPQKNLDSALEAVDNYRSQIDESQKKALQDTRAIQQDQGAPDRQGPADALGSSDPARALASSDEGGAQ